MISRVFSIVAPLVLALCAACSSGVVEEQAPPAAGEGEERVRILFSLPGDDMESPELLLLRKKIEEGLVEEGAGEIVGRGIGMGTMEIVMKPRDGSAEEVAAGVIDGIYPGARFRFERYRER